MNTPTEKTASLLQFLKHTAKIRRKRTPEYGSDTRILWLADVPRNLPQNWRGACRSAFIAGNPEDIADLWLEVRKKRKPNFPPLPKELRDWVSQAFQENPDGYVHRKTDELISLLNQRITVIVSTKGEEVAKELSIENYPHVEDLWIKYLENQWEPWAQEMRSWMQVQNLYEKVDLMRRRIEEAEERYELILALGFLQWRDSQGTSVKRHLLVAPAEISLDAARGVLTVSPAASFEKFRVELDMLELQDQPELDWFTLNGLLEDLDVRAWDRERVAEILRILANTASADAQVNENAWKPLERTDRTFRVSYAPALVLRERRPTAYEELINRFLESFEETTAFPTTAPWERFISEGETFEHSNNEAPTTTYHGLDQTDGRLYFPLPTNEEQRQIAERLKTRPYVLVKGPPGTGKSHTIANLICHLLATGERVLVTAHAPKALTVLRDLLPADIRNLCVTALGSSREDHRLLEESVRGIIARKNEWKGDEWARAEIDRLAKELDQLEEKAVRIDRQLRECREAETHSHTLPGGYTGTAAQIAREIEKRREIYGWFPELADDQNRCPIDEAETAFLADVHTSLSEKQRNELSLDIGAFDLPNPSEFEKALQNLRDAEAEARAALDGLSREQVDTLQKISGTDLSAFRVFLTKLEEEVARANRVLGDLTDEILKDLLVGQDARWNRLAQDATELVAKIQDAGERAGTARIDIPDDVDDAKLLNDTRRRLDHFTNGGRRGWGWLAPRVVRETRYLEERCRVNGGAPRDVESLDVLLGYLELRELVERFHAIWPADSGSRSSDPRYSADELRDQLQQLYELLEFFRDYGQSAITVVPVEKRISLVDPGERAQWRRLLEAESARRRVIEARRPLEAWLGAIRSLSGANAHPCMAELARAIEERDPERWSSTWAIRESLREQKNRFQRYQELLDTIAGACPELTDLLRSTQGDSSWKDRLRQLQNAWDWAAAKAWLRKVTSPEHYEQLGQERHRLQKAIERKIEELATLKAWTAFFSRLDDRTTQNLIAWTKAVARIGKGKGKFAYRHRKTARQYLALCIPKMPAWIMPLHKLWETTEPIPGIFDTVIVDEASQAGVEALTLLLLAKRIIVVGDDKQNSPEAVGVSEDDIARLARDHLGKFRFHNEFRPDTSLYDHAERAFGNVISLREHFRCVPEIIRFSNELCYRDAPLIPLRQPPPERLAPLKARFVENGACEGSGRRIINRAEAEAIVETIQACLDNPDYEGKTMGVIVLQGHAQAELIEKKLAEALEPKVREERKLRCGVPATFQGDERDVIFLSLVVAPNHHFRALTGLPDQRRFNVAMSRARDQVWLFHSVRLHDLNRGDLRWRLLHFFDSKGSAILDGLYEELDRLEREATRRPRQLGEQPDPYESWFEVDVALELLRRKYRVRPQVEVAGYRIDLVVEGQTNRLAVECDGEAWHGPDKFEHDMARQRQLERAGWTFVRIRESEFYADRESSVHRIVEACEELGILPIGEEESETDDELTPSSPEGEMLSPENEVREEQSEPSEGGEPGFPDPRTASPTNIRAALYHIIEREGPLNKRLLFKLYVEGCPTLQRVSKGIKHQLNRILADMQKVGEIVLEDEIGDRSLESQVLRLAGAPRVRERPAGQRDLLEIPPSELFLVLDRIAGKPAHSSHEDETLMRRLLQHYGFKRLTRTRRKHLDKILKAYRQRTFLGSVGQ